MENTVENIRKVNIFGNIDLYFNNSPEFGNG
jgi:hypothetical protein